MVKAIHCWFKVLTHSLDLVPRSHQACASERWLQSSHQALLIWKVLPLELKHGVLDRKTSAWCLILFTSTLIAAKNNESFTPWPGLLGASWIFVCCPFLSPLLGSLKKKTWCRMDSTWWAFSNLALLMPWPQRLYCNGLSYAL